MAHLAQAGILKAVHAAEAATAAELQREATAAAEGLQGVHHSLLTITLCCSAHGHGHSCRLAFACAGLRCQLPELEKEGHGLRARCEQLQRQLASMVSSAAGERLGLALRQEESGLAQAR